MRFRFAVLSDPHITLDSTLVDYPGRAHFYEISRQALQAVLADLRTAEIDFLLIPGDLTQNSERVNHAWLRAELAALPFQALVIPGNHDARSPTGNSEVLGLEDFAHFWQNFGYSGSPKLYYNYEVLDGVRVLGLNSNQIQGAHVVGAIDAEQLAWLKIQLASYPQVVWLVMVHHNVLEHLPGQAHNPMTAEYIIQSSELVDTLRSHGAQVVLTGHLHIQDIARQDNLYDITTGSLVSYPHPYRLIDWQTGKLTVQSRQVSTLPGWPDLLEVSLERMVRGSERYMARLLTLPPLNLPEAEARHLAPQLRYFWSTIAAGDARFDLRELPAPVRRFFERFNDAPPADNDAVLPLSGHPELAPSGAGVHHKD